MPLVEIGLLQGRSRPDLDAISDAVHEAMVAELDVPQRDRFQIITERSAPYLRFDSNYLDIDRDEGFLLVRITLAAGRTTEAKQAFYRHLAGRLAERTGMRTENLAVVMIENQREDWSFGRGQASYLELPRDAWR
jgi:phenylpyruvate tautomerase PptA (4-oxalocrotonate tautomerase family)